MTTKSLFAGMAVVSIAALAPTLTYAVTIRDGFDANTLPANDDGSTGLVDLGFAADFFGITGTQVYVNNNGNVTFDRALGTYTPFDLTSTNTQIIAPFFADIDTRSAGIETTYGQGTVDGRAAFGVNWIDVGYYAGQSDRNQLNDIQLVMIDRSDISIGAFDFEFNYGDILWETGDASGGNGGLGGSSARAGYSNGTGDAGTFFELEGSAVNGAFLNGGANALTTGSNIGVAGRFLFGARNGSIIVPPPVTVMPPVVVTPPTITPPTVPATIPLPASFALLGLGVAGLGAAGWRRKRT